MGLEVLAVGARMGCDDESHCPTDINVLREFNIQPLILSEPFLDQNLYYRTVGFWGPVEREGNFFLEAGSAIDCDTFVNALFEWHWRQNAECGATALIVDALGEGEVRIHAISRFGRTQIASQLLHAGVNRICLPRRLKSIGRLACSFGGRSQGLSILGAFWASDVAPKRRVNVNVVICTFNKIAALASSLERLCQGRPTDIGRVIVVDQGNERIEDALGIHSLSALKAGSLSILRQPNLGGSGGFARGIYEILQDDQTEGCTDILLMDDDVFFEPRLLHRYIALLCRLQSDTMVGGSMLDMARPHHLFAYTEHFNLKTGHVDRQRPHGLDMRRSKNLCKLEDAKKGNYNGWFLCSIPRSACAQHGLPLPFFVRTDDCEYGIRMTSAGVPIVHMPGFFVWHEPFWQKPRAWIEYYTFRNHFILANMCSPKESRTLILRRLGDFWHYISTYQYSIAFAACVAFEHYLEGPDKIFVDVQTRHKSIMRLFSKFEHENHGYRDNSIIRSVDCPPKGAKPRTRFSPAIPQFLRFLANVWWTLLSRHQADSAIASQAVQHSGISWASFHEFPSVIIDMPDGTSDILRIDTAVARSLTKRMVKASALMLLRGKGLHKSYQQSSSKYSTNQHWSKSFEP